MNYFEWGITFLVFQIIHFLGTFNLYKKAGRRSWEAIIPIYNVIVLTKIIKRPWWWVFLLFLPVINVIAIIVFWTLLINVFGKTDRRHIFITILTLGGYIYYLNFSTKTQYMGDALEGQKRKESFIGSIVFAVIVATLVHNYTIQPYVIPTSSLEKTLLVGDFLFVSKFHYGARVPMTAISFPMVHDQLPILGTKSYLNIPQIPYFRLPGFQKIKRNEIVVFNWPADTVRFLGDRSGIYVHKPIDKKTNYVKRCVAIAGDTIQIIGGVLWVNGKQANYPDRAKLQTSYMVKASPDFFRKKTLKERYDVTDPVLRLDATVGIVNLTQKSYKKIQTDPRVLVTKKNITPADKGYAFPRSGGIKWSRDNLGPILIPKRGLQITLDEKAMALYSRCIESYEGNKLQVKDGKYFVNGVETKTYTFKQDYYWMMGDNRHNSEDSRYWGFVPFDHIVGKPIFIWMSIDGINDGIQNFKIRWNRMFTTIHEQGKPVSYFKYFLIGIVMFYIGKSFYKRRKHNKS